MSGRFGFIAGIAGNPLFAPPHAAGGLDWNGPAASEPPDEFDGSTPFSVEPSVD